MAIKCLLLFFLYCIVAKNEIEMNEQNKREM